MDHLFQTADVETVGLCLRYRAHPDDAFQADGSRKLRINTLLIPFHVEHFIGRK
ncbi:hypothetical protein ACCW76_16655 [Pantoea sp. C8B4]|uniref:hypothetical protein n=1 Tax=Pantoea sp. C8B4 TaxID=3243083 RepID=UPI003EDA299C